MFVLLAVPVASCHLVLWMGKSYGKVQEWAPFGVVVLIATTTWAYVNAAKLISEKLVVQKKQLHFSILLYLCVSVLLILQFGGYGWFAYDLFEKTSSFLDNDSLSGLNALYFSTATFTTLGYGDLVPHRLSGRCLAAFEAALGTGHSVFFVMMYLKGGVPDDAKQIDASTTDSAFTSP